MNFCCPSSRANRLLRSMWPKCIKKKVRVGEGDKMGAKRKVGGYMR